MSPSVGEVLSNGLLRKHIHHTPDDSGVLDSTRIPAADDPPVQRCGNLLWSGIPDAAGSSSLSRRCRRSGALVLAKKQAASVAIRAASAVDAGRMCGTGEPLHSVAPQPDRPMAD